MTYKFLITHGPKKVNDFLQAVDLFNKGEGVATKEICTVICKKAVDVKKLQTAIKKGLEESNRTVFNIQQI